jgi:CheY-like chemotaxis protein
MKNKSILLVEDDSLVKGSIVRDFKKTIDDPNIGLFQGNVYWADSVDQAFTLYQANYFDLIILDLRLGKGGDGLDLLKKVRNIDQLTPIMVLSGQAEKMDYHVIGKYPNTYFVNKDLAKLDNGNPRLDRCIECLKDGEKNYEKTHRYFYLPPVISSYIFEEGASVGSPFGKKTREQLIAYLREPLAGLNGKGIYGWFDQIGETVSKHAKTVHSKLFHRPIGINIEKIIKRIRGDYSLETMEEFLNMDPYYREHFSHQFHVFLIGRLIYNTFKDLIHPHIKQMFEKYSGNNPLDEKEVPSLFEIGWFLAALFHDIGCPVQYYQALFKHYFRENFYYQSLPRLMIMEDRIPNEGLDPYFDAIVDDFWSDRDKKEEFRLLVVHQFNEKNHAIHSSIALRKQVRFNEKNGEDFSKLLTPVYSAVAMHDYEVWGNAGAVQDFLKDNEEIENRFKFHYPLHYLADLERNPLLHILLIADSMHNWGRGIGIHNLFYTYRLELIDIRQEKETSTDFLTFELNVREGENPKTSPEIFCKFCQTFKTLSVILGSNGLPVKIVLNRGIKRKSKKSNPQSYVEFRLGIGEQIDCKETKGCSWKAL